MKIFPLIIGLCAMLFLGVARGISAQELPELLDVEVSTMETDVSATETAEASASDKVNLVAPETKQTIQETKDKDLTETVSSKTDALTELVEKQKLGPMSWHNFIRYQIRGAISQGLPTNIIVILLIFPLVASIIAFSRHVIGLRGFGIYAPAVLSVVFVSTGVVLGMVLFILVILCAMLMRTITRRFALPHLPKTALILWGVAALILVFLIVAANFSWDFVILQLGIFPLLVVILLSENFMETELFSTQTEALKLTLETIIIAALCAKLISNNYLQGVVILNPELTLVATCLIDILIGRFTGLRLLEYVRFRKLIGED